MKLYVTKLNTRPLQFCIADVCDESLDAAQNLEITKVSRLIDSTGQGDANTLDPSTPWTVEFTNDQLTPTLEMSFTDPTEVTAVYVALAVDDPLKELRYRVYYKASDDADWKSIDGVSFLG